MNIPSTIADYLRRCSQELGERILQVYPALQAPGDPVSDRLNSLLRSPFAAQRLAAMGVVRRWERAKAAAVIVTLSISWPYRPRLWFNSLRPNYGLKSANANWIQQTARITRSVRVHSAALPRSLTAKARCRWHTGAKAKIFSCPGLVPP
jgi:hypothetical protein